MVKAKIIKFCIAATEKKLLKVYAIIMTGVFLETHTLIGEIVTFSVN